MKEKVLKYLKWFFNSYIWLFLLLLVIDIVTKQVVMNNMELGESIELIPSFLKISLVYNKAAAFGIGFDNPAVNRWLYVGIAVVASAGILYYFISKFNKINRIVRACLMLILTGAIGNLIDRLFYAQSGYCVVDWINFFDNAIWHWVFNIADSGVVIGAFMLVIYTIIEEVKDYRKRKASEPKDDTKVLSKTEQEKLDFEKEEEKVDN